MHIRMIMSLTFLNIDTIIRGRIGRGIKDGCCSNYDVNVFGCPTTRPSRVLMVSKICVCVCIFQ